MEQWLNTPPGKILIKMENQWLTSIFQNISGNYILQIGSDPIFVKSLNFKNKIYLNAAKPKIRDETYVIGKLNALPFMPNSMDTILLPHILETYEQAKRFLKECYDIISPEGYLVILGFQPWSLVGIQHWLLSKGNWESKYNSSYKIRSWLKKIGFEIQDENAFFYDKDRNIIKWVKKIYNIKNISDLALPRITGIYIIVAKKRVLALRPVFNVKAAIKPGWSTQR